MANVIDRSYSDIHSSDAELVRKVWREFQSAWSASDREFHRLFRAWRFVFGAEGEQWDTEALRYKLERGERAGQYDLIGPKVDRFSGSLLANTYDFRYDPITAERNTGVEGMENAYYCDKEICHFQDNFKLSIRDGVVHLGVLECKVGDKYDNMSRIYFERSIPGRWVFDPYWKGEYDDECLRGWKHGHMTIPQMERTFKRLPFSEKLDSERRRLKKMGMDWTEKEIDEYNVYDPTFMNAYQVVEYHYVENIKTQRLIALNPEGTAVVFPITKNEQELEHFAMLNGVTDWKEANIYPYKDKIHKCVTICPDLFDKNTLEKGKPEVQVGGLPTIQFTCHRDISGRNKGLVENLIDAQKDVNYNKSKIHEYLANALGGGLLYDKTRLPNESDQEDFEKNSNDPTKSWGIDGSPDGFLRRIVDAQPNNVLLAQASEAIDLMDRISNVSAAAHSETQSSDESGKLFAYKLQQQSVGTITVADRVKYVRLRMAEMYYKQGQISYSGAPKHFTSRDGSRKVVLNEPVLDRFGHPCIKNRVEDLPRCSVTITEAEDNLTRNERTAKEVGQILKVLPPEYRESWALAFNKLIKTTGLSDAEKDEFEQSTKIEIVKARMANMTEISNMQANIMQSKLVSEQAKMQLQQLMAQMNGGQQGPQTPEMMSPDEESQPEGITRPDEYSEQPASAGALA